MKYAFLIVVGVVAACAKPTERVVNARPKVVADLKQGDCVEARARLASDPAMPVDKLPEKVSGPTPFTPTPPSVAADIKKNGMSFKADVMIDTLGKPILSSLKVVESSNEWFARNLNALLPRMTFSPAMLVGCKVERVYKFLASAKPAP